MKNPIFTWSIFLCLILIIAFQISCYNLPPNVFRDVFIGMISMLASIKIVSFFIN